MAPGLALPAGDLYLAVFTDLRLSGFLPGGIEVTRSLLQLNSVLVPARCPGAAVGREDQPSELPMLGVEFRILGPLEVRGARGPLDVTGTRQRVVLAALLLSANRVVTLDRLTNALYDDHPPTTARAQAQTTVSALRRVLAAAGGTSAIITHPQGYVIRVADGQLDSLRFADLVAEARSARDAGHPERAVARYRDALRVWRGHALAGIDSYLIRIAADHLDEQRITVNEDRIALELDLGRHHELAAELAELIEQFPLRERLREQLMIALYRCDRTAEAVQVYRDTRRVMIDELGIEPNGRLKRLEHAILTSDPALDLAGGRAVIRAAPRLAPRMLPADIADFTGRRAQVEAIHQYLTGEDQAGLAVRVAVVSGRGGVGKTSLAVHAAHGVAATFADGQLFADLHGASHPMHPVKVLDRFLRALGLAGSQIPDSIEERAEAYRTLLGDRKILVVLDDAANEAQVSALLPGTPTSAVIVTSRGKLAGLAGAEQITVDVFDADSSIALLSRIVGTERVTREPQATAKVTELCGHLPLALRIAGARVSARPHWSIQRLVEHLADETSRLDELCYGDMTVRASISLSYEGTSELARRLFRRLAILNLRVFSDWAAAALLDEQFHRTQDLLDELVSAQLVEAASPGPPGQYRMHDLIRLFAGDRLAAEEKADARRAALGRFLGALLHLTEAAHRRLYGGDYVRLTNDAKRWVLPDHVARQLVADPLSWFERERGTLISGVRQAAQAGMTELCWGLALGAVTLYESRVYLDDWQETHQVALDAVQRVGAARGEAAMLYSTGTLSMVEQRFGAALDSLSAAARLFREMDDAHGLALVTRHVAYLDRLSGRLDEAASSYEQALRLFRAEGDPVAVAYVLHGLADVKLEQGAIGQARELLAEALRLSQGTHSGRVEAQVLYRMGEVCLRAGEPGRAADAFGNALARVHDAGDPLGEAYALLGIGVARVREGKSDLAHAALQRSMVLAHTVGDRLVEARVLLGRAELALVNGDPVEAAALADKAASVFSTTGASLYEKQAHVLLGSAQAELLGPSADPGHRDGAG